ncbi:MAG: competence protein TfoX [Muricauda sp.]|nr:MULTISPECIES: TfoX/Sxy family protein [unclassified Allomuricauda]MAU14519.1 competence protein TfoX [Allomuricauda sp.]|tara:strand:+ start:161 stop:490 length:330 start_codon:yes stop_codon:yes gene_type:complete
MAISTDYLDFVLDQLSNWRTVRPKKMFGCIGLYAEGVIFGVIAKETVFLKVDDTNKKHYIEAGSESLKLFKNNTTVPSYYEVPIDILENAEQFTTWAEQSLTIQMSRSK